MLKTTLMTLGLAAVLALGTACFGLFTADEPPATTTAACAGLSGEALADCEQRHRP